MCDLGITPENFNPRILFLIKMKFNCESVMTYHTHDFIELKYVLSGSCTYNIDGTLYEVKKGDIVLSNPGIYHQKIINPGDEVLEIHLGFNNICIENFQKNCLIPATASPVITLSKYESDFFKCCTEIMQEQEKAELGSDLIVKSLAMKLIVLLLKETYLIENFVPESIFNFESYEKAGIINTIVSYINENYMDYISLNKISKNMYLSSVYISKIFKEEIGDSPINYLIKIRLKKARELLEKGDLPIKAVAKSVGYEDAYHFSKLFKKYFGVSPSKVKNSKE